MKKKLQSAAKPEKARRDYVGKSGVYPMSGPHPQGNAPVRGQMEWGQGERGIAGYYDHGSSALSMESGVLVGGFDQKWTGAPQEGSAVPPVTEIPVAEWPAFCAWFTENFRGTVINLENQEEEGTRVEARNRPFEELTAHLLDNSVGAITVVAEGKPKKIRLNVAGPQKLTLYRNAAGWATKLEITHARGTAILHLTGEIELPPDMSSNAWGE
jgi:hypothetical protein